MRPATVPPPAGAQAKSAKRDADVMFFAPNDSRGQTDPVARICSTNLDGTVHSWPSSRVAPEVDRLRTRQSTDRPRNLTVPPFTTYRRGALRLSSMTGLVRRNPHQWVKQSRDP